MIKTINIKNINWSKLHICFFYLFLFSIPLQTRKVFLTQYSFYSGAFTEYASFFIYASDIFLILTLFFWLAFNKHKTVKLRKIQLFLFAFIIWLIINTIINSDYLEISIFQIFKFIELFLLVAYIYFNLANKKILLTSLFIISLAGFLQSLIAIYQFLLQQSLFNLSILAKITGEPIIGPQIPGIAKIIADGEKIVRAYGTFPHSNVLGGFLILSIIISSYFLLEHKYAILSRYKLNYIQFYNTKFKKSQIKFAVSLVWITIIFAQITALLFTFSRSAWIGFTISIMTLSFLLYIKRFKIVSRETILYTTKNNMGEINYNPYSVSRETFLKFKGKLNCYLLAIFISFLFIGLFDHYFWTLQQGRLIFWLVLGILLIDARFRLEDN